MAQANNDQVVGEFREQIAAIDRTILDSVNRRLELVAGLKRHKELQGLPFFDPEREAALITALTEANLGPLSDEGVRSLYTDLLALIKRELDQ